MFNDVVEVARIAISVWTNSILFELSQIVGMLVPVFALIIARVDALPPLCLTTAITVKELESALPVQFT